MSLHSFSLTNESGNELIKASEIRSIPPNAYRLNSGSNSEKEIVHLISDIAKGATSVPNKTLELVFSPEIQKGLETGTYTLMIPKSGKGLFADVIGADKKIVGKGRFVEGGKVKQLASGAFQLVSIAVAQSHLADIDESLSKLNYAVESIIKHMENEDKSKVTGALEYLKGIAKDITQYRSAEELSSQKRVIIESIIKDSHSWIDKAVRDFQEAILAIESQKDEDRFGGTEASYERLKMHVSRVDSIYEKRELLCELNKLIYLILMYVDPSLKNYSKPNVKNEIWKELIVKYRNAILNKNEQLLSKAFWNSSSTLNMRKENIEFRTNSATEKLINQSKFHSNAIQTLDRDLQRFLKGNELKIALSFNEKGVVEDAAFI